MLYSPGPQESSTPSVLGAARVEAAWSDCTVQGHGVVCLIV
uniref:Calpain 11 n=1 Tax=Homo sapiens TaxID=9606 RepID=E9PIX3_HUMAN